MAINESDPTKEPSPIEEAKDVNEPTTFIRQTGLRLTEKEDMQLAREIMRRELDGDYAAAIGTFVNKLDDFRPQHLTTTPEEVVALIHALREVFQLEMLALHGPNPEELPADRQKLQDLYTKAGDFETPEGRAATRAILTGMTEFNAEVNSGRTHRPFEEKPAQTLNIESLGFYAGIRLTERMDEEELK